MCTAKLMTPHQPWMGGGVLFPDYLRRHFQQSHYQAIGWQIGQRLVISTLLFGV